MGFREDVCQVVKSIPKGKTLSYSQVATLAGRPGAPRAVVRVLNASSGLPWWRVIRADRTLAEPVATEQARRLRAEGVKVEGRRVVGGKGLVLAKRAPVGPAVKRPARPAPRRSARARR